MNPALQQHVEAAMRGEKPATAALLHALSLPYGAAVRGRNLLFDYRLRSQHPLPRPTISVGNLTTGGTGKTPVVAWLAERLRHHGHVAGILTRGYGAAPGTVADEVVELQRHVGDAIEANPDRLAGADALLRRRPDVSVLLLDDAFQHRRVARHADLVLLDATNPFGFDHVLPRGHLREPLSGLRRATAVLITKSDLADPEPARRRVPAAIPVFTARQHVTVADVEGPYAAFCGLGNPDAFFATVARTLGPAEKSVRFPDHHRYTSADAAKLRRLDLPLVCSRKDAVKLTAIDLPVHVAELSIDVDAGLLDLLLRQLNTTL